MRSNVRYSDLLPFNRTPHNGSRYQAHGVDARLQLAAERDTPGSVYCQDFNRKGTDLVIHRVDLITHQLEQQLQQLQQAVDCSWESFAETEGEDLESLTLLARDLGIGESSFALNAMASSVFLSNVDSLLAEFNVARRRICTTLTFLLITDALTSITPVRPATAANSDGRTSSSHSPAPTLPDSDHPWSRWAEIERTSASYASAASRFHRDFEDLETQLTAGQVRLDDTAALLANLPVRELDAMSTSVSWVLPVRTQREYHMAAPAA